MMGWEGLIDPGGRVYLVYFLLVHVYSRKGMKGTIFSEDARGGESGRVGAGLAPVGAVIS